jgi:hypothetical protein
MVGLHTTTGYNDRGGTDALQSAAQISSKQGNVNAQRAKPRPVKLETKDIMKDLNNPIKTVFSWGDKDEFGLFRCHDTTPNSLGYVGYRWPGIYEH